MDGVPDVTQPPVKPGETFTYEFVAKGPALGIYHSHHHAEHQVPDGLFGVFQVGDVALPAGTGPVAQEVPMVLNDAGVIGFSLNGKSFPATAPVIRTRTRGRRSTTSTKGSRSIRCTCTASATRDREGRLPGAAALHGRHARRSRRGAVLGARHPTDDEKGVWAFHCHILNHAEGDNGMFGMVTTMIVQ